MQVARQARGMSGKRELNAPVTLPASRGVRATSRAVQDLSCALRPISDGVRASLTPAPGQASRQAREKVSCPVFGLALVRPPADPYASVRYAGLEKDQVGMIDSCRAVHVLCTARESPPTTSEPYFYLFVSGKR
jgi:hypothetical protein